jgi:ligand-binding sensor domain-containing protein/two-component sensor histidine kinase
MIGKNTSATLKNSNPGASLANWRRIGFAAGIAGSLCFLFFHRCARAERLPIRTYTTADGLPRDHINRIVQDSKGFMWFCTSEGLSQFDGYRFINYGMEHGLAGRQVLDFLETRNGVYWAATDKGLCRFIPDALPQPSGGPPGSFPRRFLVYCPSADPDTQSINAIYEDHAGTIWCGTQAGLYRVDQNRGVPVFSLVNIIQPAPTSDSKLHIQSVVEDRAGSLWTIAQSGLYRLWPDGTVDRYTAEEGLPAELSRALVEDRDGRIWVASDRGLYELVRDPQPHRSIISRLYTVKDGLPSNHVFCLSQSPDGTLWIGTSRGLTALYPTQGNGEGPLQTYTEANGLSGSLITSLCEDHDHNLWVGTDSGGAMKLAATGFVSYDERDGLGSTRRIGSIIEDRAGQLCVITDDTISRLDGGRLTAVPLRPPAGVFSWGWGWYQIMFQDSTGEWWLTSDQGLVRYPRLTSIQQFTRARPKAIYKERDGLPTDFVFRLFEDSRHDIWISTLGNPKAVLTRWERATKTFHAYQTADGLPEAAPTAFCEDSAGNLWIGFYADGLRRYRDGHFERFAKSEGVPPGMVRGFYLDHAHRLWIATGEGGVARVDQPAAEHPAFVTYSAANGLCSNQATCVTEDNWGMIYIGTGRGLDKLDPATGHIRHYSTADGLANSFVNVSFRRADGSLWFGTLQGLSRLVPQPERPPGRTPVFVTALKVAGVSLPVPALGAAEVVGPVLGATQNNVQIDFSGLNLAPGESLRYQYELQGASSDWSLPTDQRSISYANLAPGTYRFLVRAVGSDGVGSEPPASVTFRILAPFWRRWWFMALAGALVALATYGLYRYRVRRLLEIERVRTRIAADLHDDIGANLTRIGILSEVAHTHVQAQESGISSPLGSIAQISRECVASMGDIVWAIDPARDHLIDLVQRMRRFAGEVFSNRKIEFEFHAPPSDEDLTIGPDVRRNVFLIFKEAVNNAARHAHCSYVAIDLALERSGLVLKIGDNGSGFDPSEAGEGQGLASMKRRAADLGARLLLSSAKGKGTEIELTVPRKTR